MYAVRVTTLEKYRRFRDEVTETYDTEQSVIDTLTGTFTGNDLTQIGEDFHKFIETGVTGKNIATFNDEQINIALKHRESLLPFIAEVSGKKTYNTLFGDLTVTGRMDVLQGNIIRDTKTKFSPPVFIDYYKSYQWRLYLDLFCLDRFIYDVFEFSGHDGTDVSNYEIKQHDQFECISYERMQQDINTLLNDFMSWINFRNLQHLIQQK